MRKDQVKHYYLDENYNCAESLIRVLNEDYHLDLETEDMKLVGGFGGGMGCGLTCGALAAAIAALGKLYIKDKAHGTPGFRELCGSFVDQFRKKLGDVDCAELKKANFVPGTRCLKTVELAGDLLEAFVEAHPKA